MCVHGCKSNKDAQQFVKRNATQKEKCNATSSGVAFFVPALKCIRLRVQCQKKGSHPLRVAAFFICAVELAP
jgi:hypothetical protein